MVGPLRSVTCYGFLVSLLGFNRQLILQFEFRDLRFKIWDFFYFGALGVCQLFLRHGVQNALVLLCVSLNNIEKPLVLLCFHSKMLKNLWFDCVFAQKC